MNVMTPIVRDPNQEQFDTRRLLAHAQQQAEDRKYEDFMIVDVDAHHYETGSYKEIFGYIEDPVLRDQFVYTKGATLMTRSTGGYRRWRGASRATSIAPPRPRPTSRIATSPSRANGWTRSASTSPASFRPRCWGSASTR